MVIHSSPGSRRRKKILKAQQEEIKKNMASALPEKKVAKQEPIVESLPIIDDPTAEEFIATLPKKPNKKKVIKPVEE